MKKINVFTMIVFLFVSFNSIASESVLSSLATCNSSFFKSLKAYPSLSDIIDKVQENDFKKNPEIIIDVDFTTPEGIHLKQFVVQYTDFNKYMKSGVGNVTGEFYFWGFRTTDSLEYVVKEFPINLEKNSSDLYVANPMIKNNNGDWVVNSSAASGIAPEDNTTEKLFMVEKSGKDYTTLYCSIQGKLSESDVKNTGLIK